MIPSLPAVREKKNALHRRFCFTHVATHELTTAKPATLRFVLPPTSIASIEPGNPACDHRRWLGDSVYLIIECDYTDDIIWTEPAHEKRSRFSGVSDLVSTHRSRAIENERDVERSVAAGVDRITLELEERANRVPRTTCSQIVIENNCGLQRVSFLVVRTS